MSNANTTTQNAQNAEFQLLTANSGTYNGFTFSPFEKEWEYNGVPFTESVIRIIDGERIVSDFGIRSDMTLESQVKTEIQGDIQEQMAAGIFSNTDLVGMFISCNGYSDVNCIGKIVGTFGKTGITVEPWDATEQTEKMEFIAGGFSGHCVNNHNQKWDFAKADRANFGMRLGKGFYKSGNRVNFTPQHHYDYNF